MIPQQRFTPGQFGGKAGIVLAAIGLLLILMGWNGAAGQLSILAQVPYILSGGVLGIAFVILGGAMLIVQGNREDRALIEAKLDLLAEAYLEGSGRTKAAVPGDVSGLVVAGRASFHRSACRLVDGREETNYLTPAEASGRGLKPCRVCQPQAAAPDIAIH